MRCQVARLFAPQCYRSYTCYNVKTTESGSSSGDDSVYSSSRREPEDKE